MFKSIKVFSPIININKGSPQGVGGQQNSTDASSGQGTDGQNFIYFKIPVQYEIKGNFLGYLKLQEQQLHQEPIHRAIE